MNPPNDMKMLPQEIIVDILTRLPAKSIGRFRCVSKPWKSLLSQPHFIKTHLKRSKHLPTEKESLVLFSDYSQSLYTIQLKNVNNLLDEITIVANEFRFDDHHLDSVISYRNMASCDGLVLVADENDKLVLMNPTTKEIKELPLSPYSIDPHASYTMYALGYDSATDDYKVVTVSYYNFHHEDESDYTEMFVNIYSVKNGNWKRAESSPYNHVVGHLPSGVCIDGYIYWLASRPSDYSSVIAAFDLGGEKFCELPPPTPVDIHKICFIRLGVLGGCLTMFPSTRNRKTGVWVMKQHGVEESWTKFTIIDHEDSEFRPLCFLGKEQVMLVKNEESMDEKLVMYNLEEGTFKDIVVHGLSHRLAVGRTFIESLVSPHYNDEDVREG